MVGTVNIIFQIFEKNHAISRQLQVDNHRISVYFRQNFEIFVASLEVFDKSYCVICVKIGENLVISVSCYPIKTDSEKDSQYGIYQQLQAGTHKTAYFPTCYDKGDAVHL